MGIFRRAEGVLRRDYIDCEDTVLRPINLRVNAEAEEVLVVVGVDTGVNLSSPPKGVFVGVHGVSV